MFSPLFSSVLHDASFYRLAGQPSSCRECAQAVGHVAGCWRSARDPCVFVWQNFVDALWIVLQRPNYVTMTAVLRPESYICSQPVCLQFRESQSFRIKACITNTNWVASLNLEASLRAQWNSLFPRLLRCTGRAFWTNSVPLALIYETGKSVSLESGRASGVSGYFTTYTYLIGLCAEVGSSV